MSDREKLATPPTVPHFRSIVTVVDSDPGADARLAAAIEIARREDAHLTVLALRYDPGIPTYAFGGGGGAAVAQLFDRTREEAETLARTARDAIEAAGIRGEAVPCATMFRDVETEVAGVARFADLAVVSPPFGEDTSGTALDILDGILYDCDVPALVLAADAAPPETDRILIGWDGSRQALRAVKGALPVLRRAGAVEICIFDPKSGAPGESLAKMLARYDVPVEVAALPRPPGSKASALAQRAREIGAGLLVMGAYGHSRFRETVMGGVTQDTLKNVQIPVLMAH